MAVRNNFAAGEVLLAADLNDTFASKLDLAGKKVLQIVRATDTSNRQTNSATYVDATSISVTITPQKSDSAILLIVFFVANILANSNKAPSGTYRITDSSNTAISGAEASPIDHYTLTSGGEMLFPCVLSAYATPATTSATTYKVRIKTADTDRFIRLRGDLSTTQFFAIEVSA